MVSPSSSQCEALLDQRCWLLGTGGDSGGAVKLGPGLSILWKRAFGVTKTKRRVPKTTGIQMSRGGLRMKLGKWLVTK